MPVVRGWPCYNRISVPAETPSVSETAPVLPPNDPVEQLYRELEAKVREYRPKDDLAPLEKGLSIRPENITKARPATRVNRTWCIR